MSLRLATRDSVFERSAEQTLCRCTSRYQSSVTKHATKQCLKCSVDWYQPMHKHRANDEPQIGFHWSDWQPEGIQAHFLTGKTSNEQRRTKRPHPLLWAGPRACSWKNTNTWNTCLICRDIFKLYTIYNCGRGSETHDAVGTTDTDVL